MRTHRYEGVESLQFPGVDPAWPLIHGITTRAGGVSPGTWASLNLGFGSGDEPARVRENQRRACAALGLSPRHLVYMQQVHSANVSVIGEPTADPVWATGKLRRLPDTDALITAQPGVVLLARGADCPLVLLYAPDRQVVGVVHSGWRGTFANIAGRAVTRLRTELGCDPARCLPALHRASAPNTTKSGRSWSTGCRR